MTYTNPLIDAWANGRQLLGSWCTLPSSLMAEIAGRQGLDYVCVDLQHGMIDDSSSISMLQGIAASGSIPIVRSRWNEPAAIMSALDSGALGIVVPMINNAKEAIAAIDTVDKIEISGQDRFTKSEEFIKNCLKNIIPISDQNQTFSLPQFFCTFSFFDQHQTTDYPFPSATVFLPAWQIALKNS